LQVLLSADNFAKARSLIEQEHRGESLVCAGSQIAAR
jgi:hypothetical protein